MGYCGYGTDFGEKMELDEFMNNYKFIVCPVLDLRPYKQKLLGSDKLHYSLEA